MRIASGTDIVVLVDALDGPDAASDVVASAVPAGVPADATVLLADLRDARAVAAWVLAEQQRLERRVFVAVLVAGGPQGALAVDDLLAAGALVDELITLGLDDTSPEAAVAAAAFAGLRRAARHLTTASGSGRAALAAGVEHDEVVARAVLDSRTDVRRVRAAVPVDEPRAAVV